MSLIRDKEFEHFLPNSSSDEDSELEQMLLEDGGPHDPICVWQGTGIIVDGYRRHKICTEHALPYQIKELAFVDRDDVRAWIIRKQISRRNVNTHSRIMLLGMYAEARLKAKPTQTVSKTVDQTAEALKANPRTVYRARAYKKAFDSLPPDLQELVEKHAPRATHVLELADRPPGRQKEIAKAWADGGELPILLEDPQEDEESKPKRPRPPAKPAKDRLQDAIETIGKLKRQLDVISSTNPAPHYQRAIDALSEAGEELVAWKNLESL